MAADADALSFLRLARLRGVGPVLVKRLLDSLGSADAILAAHPATLAAVDGIGTVKANQIITSRDATLADSQAELARTQAARIQLLTPADPLYPPALKTISDPPLVLYVRGQLLPADAVAIGIVGARECTLYGREQATRLGSQLAEVGLTVVSGGARGIDTCAHLGSLRSGGRTIVVQGCGLAHTYPPENVDLYQRIIDAGGAIISELPIDTPPTAQNFPPRNRIIAGMSLGIVVVEANLRSGSLITARLAAADYGREVFALPGRVDSPASAGTHHLIKSATAHLVETVDDILAHLGDVGRLLEKARAQEIAARTSGKNAAIEITENRVPAAPPKGNAHDAPAPEPLTTTQQKILHALAEKQANIDELVDSTGLAPQTIMAELTLLQIKKRIRRTTDNRFVNA